MAAWSQGTAIDPATVKLNCSHLGPTPPAECTLSRQNGSNPPNHAIDTTNGSYAYTPDPSVANDYWEIDLGNLNGGTGLTRVGAVVMSFAFDLQPANFHLQVSTDGSTWTTVYNVTSADKDSFTGVSAIGSSSHNWYAFWNHTNIRYFRMVQDTASSSGGWAIDQVNFYAGAALAAPTLSSWAIDATGLFITATISQSGVTPSSGSGSGGFTLTGTNRTVSGWSISGTTLTLTASGAIGTTKTVTLSYDGTAALTNGDNAIATISNASVTNNSVIAAPTLGNFTVPSSGVTMTANLSETSVIPTSGSGAGGFTIHGGAITVQGWSITSNVLTLSLSGKIVLNDPGAPFTVDYSSATGTLTNGDDILATVSGKTVTNNSTVVGNSESNFSFFGLQG